MSERSGVFQWRGVPPSLRRAWNDVFSAAFDRHEGLNVTGACPVCGAACLHQWYHLNERRPSVSGTGNRFAGSGSLWEWCSDCGSFQHYSAAVPDWWSCDLPVDERHLGRAPGPIEEARVRAERGKSRR